jgi:hopanoid biosynthesis associated protein HpnK
MGRNAGRYLVTVADDFGASPSINRAVAEAFDRGLLRAASLMAGGPSFDGAIEAARKRKALSVGLHLTLCDGRAVLPNGEIPDIADADGNFEKNPARAWIKYRGARILKQVDSEIAAQFDRLEKSGVRPTHVDGHHHLHMHPAIFKMVCRHAAKRGVRWIRVPNEPLSAVLSMRAASRGAMPFIEWVVFGVLGVLNARTARIYGLNVPDKVFGLSRTGQVDEGYLMRVLDRAGDCVEVFAHPDTGTDAGKGELAALTSQAVKKRLTSLGIVLAGYRELSRGAGAFTALDRP